MTGTSFLTFLEDFGFSNLKISSDERKEKAVGCNINVKQEVAFKMEAVDVDGMNAARTAIPTSAAVHTAKPTSAATTGINSTCNQSHTGGAVHCPTAIS